MFFIGAMFIVAVAFCVCIRRKSCWIATAILVNIVYIARCFFPSMVLAFIQDPMEVILTCLIAVAVVGLFVLLTWIQCFMPYPLVQLQTAYSFVMAALGAFAIFLYFLLIATKYVYIGEFQ